MGTGVNISTDLKTLGDSQVCGQCHGSFTNVARTLGHLRVHDQPRAARPSWT